MADNTEDIGGVSISVTGDFSQLQSDLDNAASAAATAGNQIADALTTGLDRADNSLVATGGQLDLFGTAVKDAAEQFTLFDTNSIEATDSMVQMGDGAGQATTSLNELGEAATKSGDAAKESEGFWNDFGESLLELAGIALTAEGLKDLATDALESYASVQKATIALTALTGSAAGAAETIEGLKGLAQSDALSFPSLVTAQQRMTAFGFSAQQIPGLMQAMADASAATGRGFDQVNSAVDRMVLSGTAGARQLAALGLSLNDLAAAANTDSASVAAAFKAMDPSDRITIIEDALQEYAGTAEAVAQSVSGQFQKLKNDADFALEALGDDIAPAALALMKLADTATQMGQTFFTSFGNMEQSVAKLAQAILNLPAPPQAFTNFLSQLGSQVVQQFSMPFELLAAAAKQATIAVEDATQHYTDMGTAAEDVLTRLNKANADYNKGLQTLGQQYTSNSTGLQQLITDQDKANKAVTDAAAVLGEARNDLQQGAISQQVFNDALNAYDAAVLKAAPHGKDYADSIAGISDSLNKAQEKFSSLLAIFVQVSGALQQETISTNAYIEVSNKLAAAAKAVGDTFTDWFADYLKLDQEVTQSTANLQAQVQVFQQVKSLYQDGAASLQELTQAYNNAEAAAKKAGQSFSDAATAADLITQKAKNQVAALQASVATLGDLAKQNDATITGQQALALALQGVQSAANTLGVSVTKIGDAYVAAAKVATPAAQALVTQINQWLAAQGLLNNTLDTGFTVTKNLATGVTEYRAAADGAATSAKNLGSMVVDANTGIVQYRASVDGATGSIGSLSKAAGNAGTIISNVTDAAGHFVVGLNAIATSATNAGGIISNMTDAEGHLLTGINAVNSAASGAPGIINNMTDALGHLVTTATSAASALNTLAAAEKNVSDGFEGIAGGAGGSAGGGFGEFQGNLSSVAAGFGQLFGNPLLNPLMGGGPGFFGPALGTSGLGAGVAMTGTSPMQNAMEGGPFVDDIAAFDASVEANAKALGDSVVTFTNSWGQALEKLGPPLDKAATAASSAATSLAATAAAGSSADVALGLVVTSVTPVASAVNALTTAATAASDALTGAAVAAAEASQTINGAMAVTASIAVAAVTALGPALGTGAMSLGPDLSNITSIPTVPTTFSGGASSTNPSLQNSGKAITFNLTVNAGNVVGQNGMQQLSDMVGKNVIQQLQQTAGQKLF